MRTDSLRISDTAAEEAAQYIAERYGEQYLYKGTARTYKRKNSSVQDAHEAIRPTSVYLTPEKVKGSLTSDQYKLYKLIWDRLVASRMSDQLQDTVSVDIECGDYLLRANGRTIVFDGFSRVYEASKDEKEETAVTLPQLTDQTQLRKKDILPIQRFTQPPPRYTEATLIKTLEENGIGRPSTYAPTISTILQRGYVERLQKSLKPTVLGMIVTDLMIAQFPSIVDEEFSASMEKNLDRIEEGKADWVKTLGKFYKDFEKSLKQAEASMEGQRLKVPEEESDVECELCGRMMVYKTGRYGKFLACPGFPDCRNTKRIVTETPAQCPKCEAKVLQRRSSKGRIFYSCEKGKDCGFMTWNEPTAEKCPQCGASLFKKGGKSPTLNCLKEGCGYSVEIPK